MALKGMTKIELTNVKTGEVETVEKHNMVTNALKSVLSNPFGWQTRSNFDKTYTVAGNIMPICPNVIGGILLYESQIPEDPDQIFAQPGNVLVGYSNNEVNTTDDAMRGSINVNESGPLESGDGYRFVFDFNTAQANGTIGAVGLTSKWGGMSGPGSEYSSTKPGMSPTPTIWQYKLRDIIRTYSDQFEPILSNIVAYNESTNIATSVNVISPGNITVIKFAFNVDSWPVIGGVKPQDFFKTVESNSIMTETFAKNLRTFTGGQYTSYYGYYNFCDGGDGYIWGFEHENGAQGNSSGKANVNWIKIDIETLEFEEGTWEIDAQIYQFGKKAYPILYTMQGSMYLIPSSTILDGYLYCYQYDFKKIIKIDMKNITNIALIDMAGYSKLDYQQPQLRTYGNVVHSEQGYINGNKFVHCNVGQYSGRYETTTERFNMDDSGYGPQCDACNVFGFGVFLLRATVYIGFSFILSLCAHYLATINNLPAPVEKTADKTMKITYIIREETGT